MHALVLGLFGTALDLSVFARMMLGLAEADADPSTLMIDATYLKAHRTASSLRLKKGGASA